MCGYPACFLSYAESRTKIKGDGLVDEIARGGKGERWEGI
jgi:hypothetical protein